MDVPISLALILASGISLSETLMGGRHAYFDAAVSLTFFLLAGRYLDHRTRAVARSAAEELAALEVPRATVLRDGVEVVLPLAQVAVGDLVRVRPGGRMPVDGIVTDGQQRSRPLVADRRKPALPCQPRHHGQRGRSQPDRPADPARAGGGAGHCRCTGWPIWSPSPKAPRPATPVWPNARRGSIRRWCISCRSGAFGFWMWQTGGDVRFAVNISAAVLIITCPCALGLAVPAVVTAASGKLFRKGLLIKHGTALERLAEVDTVVFDKTGTLTLGLPQPVDLGRHAPDVLAVAAGAGGGVVASAGRGAGGAGHCRGRCGRPARGAGLWHRRPLAGPDRASGPRRLGRGGGACR